MSKAKRYRDDISWMVDAAAEACNVKRADIMSMLRQRPLPEIRRGIIWFLRDQQWSTPRIGLAMHRDHGTVIHALQKGPPEPGEHAFVALKAVQTAWIERATREQEELLEHSRKVREAAKTAFAEKLDLEQQRIWAEEEAEMTRRAERNVAMLGDLIRVEPSCGKSRSVAILIKHKGRAMPTRRISKGEAGDIVASEPRHYRLVPVPDFMGGVAMVPVDESEWREASEPEAMKVAAE